MYPVINIFGFEIQSYALISAVGFAVTVLLVLLMSGLRNIPKEKSLMATLVSGLGLFAGGHLLFALTNLNNIVKVFSNGFSVSSLLPYISGMVFYGGLFGAVLSLLIYTRLDASVSRKDIFDIFALAVPLFHSFGRIGCFFAGCCYGIESDFGITTYLNPSPTHFGVSRFPVSLTEAFANVLIFVLILYLYKRNKFKGELFFIYLSVYAPLRFILEFFRGDKIRGFVFTLSTSQFISLLIILFLCIYYVRKLFRKGSYKS